MSLRVMVPLELLSRITITPAGQAEVSKVMAAVPVEIVTGNSRIWRPSVMLKLNVPMTFLSEKSEMVR